MPLLLPAHHFCGDRELVAIDLREAREFEVLQEELVGIHVELGGEVVERGHGQHTGLGMVGRSPGTRGADVVANGGVLFVLVRDAETVRNRRHAAASGPARPPGMGLPGDERAVFFRANFHASIGGRTRARHLEFRIAFQHHAHGLAVGFLGELRGHDAPAVRTELAAEATAHVILVHADVGGGQFQRFGHLTGNSGDILRGHMHEEVVGIGPLGGGTVSFHTAMHDDGSTIEAFGSGIGLGECLVDVPLRLGRCFYIVGLGFVGGLGMHGRVACRLDD